MCDSLYGTHLLGHVRLIKVFSHLLPELLALMTPNKQKKTKKEKEKPKNKTK